MKRREKRKEDSWKDTSHVHRRREWLFLVCIGSDTPCWNDDRYQRMTKLHTNEPCPKHYCPTNDISDSVIISGFSCLALSEERLPRESGYPTHVVRRSDAAIFRVHSQSSSGDCFNERHWITVGSDSNSDCMKSKAYVLGKEQLSSTTHLEPMKNWTLNQDTSPSSASSYQWTP